MIVAASLVLLFWMALSWQRSFIWKDEVTLFVQSSQEGPKTARVQENAVAAIFHLPQVEQLFLLDKSTRKLQPVGGITRLKARQALQTLTEAQRLFSEDENISAALGITYSALGETNQAIHFFESAVRQKPREADFWSNLGMAYSEAGQTVKAREALETALTLDTDNLNALRSASRLYWETEDFSAALRALKKLQEREPNNPDHSYWIRQVEQKLPRPVTE